MRKEAAQRDKRMATDGPPELRLCRLIDQFGFALKVHGNSNEMNEMEKG